MEKTPIRVDCGLNEKGTVVPKRITWKDGRKWDVAGVISIEASYTGEYDGLRYKVRIGNAVKNIYRLGSQWYVEAKK